MYETSSIPIKHADIIRGPHQIAFDITNKCNLRCLHCYNASGENQVFNDELSDEQVLTLMKELAGLQLYNLCFCGGEPLLRKNLIVKCARILSEHNVPNISMVTNGLLMTKEIALELKEAGVTRVQVSLDGANACSHDRLRNQEGSFDKAIEAIKILKSVDMDPNIAFTPTSFNIDQFTELHELLRSLGLEDIELRSQPLMLLGRANKHLESIKPTDMQYRKLVKEINRLKKQEKGPNAQWGDPVDHLVRFRNVISCVNHTTIRANGDIVVSPYLPLVVGNVKKHSFIEYWDGGLGKVWEKRIPNELAKNIVSVEDMNVTYDNLPVVWQDKDIYIDLLESDLDDYTLITG